MIAMHCLMNSVKPLISLLKVERALRLTGLAPPRLGESFLLDSSPLSKTSAVADALAFPRPTRMGAKAEDLCRHTRLPSHGGWPPGPKRSPLPPDEEPHTGRLVDLGPSLSDCVPAVIKVIEGKGKDG
jgi:hypothetical protein